MKSRQLQELVRKVFGDERTRLQFEADPHSVLARFSLTEQEKKAVLSTHARFGVVSSSSGQLGAVIKSASPWIASM